MNEQDIAALDKATPLTLAAWWCALNRYEWPEALGGPKPAEYVRNGRREEIMAEISNRITRKECLRELNKTNLPGKKFDDWWDVHWPNDGGNPRERSAAK